MKANELRIGNKFKFIDRTVTISGILSIGVCFVEEYRASDEINIDDLKPIPLTEEWLLKLGFEKTGIEGLNERFLKEHKGLEVGLRFIKKFSVYKLGFIGTEIKYVHQLQNLYFSLTGTELTIKRS